MSMQQVRDEASKRDEKESTEHDSFVDYTEPPSLESIALISTAVRLWTEPDVYFDTINNQYSYSYSFIELKERVLNKLTRLILPDLLKIKILNFIEPIGLQLFKSNYYLYERKCDFHTIHSIGGSIYYTMEGVIDNLKSLSEVISNGDQAKDIGILYELACIYCLEEKVSYLWQKMSSEEKKMFHRSSYNTYNDHIVDYWTAYLENELPNFFSKITNLFGYEMYDSNQSIYRNMTSMSVFVGNIFALKYFWKTLTEQEKNINIDYWINLVLRELSEIILFVKFEYKQYNPFAHILFFLLSKLNDQYKQNHIFKTSSKIILETLLFCWPWQRFFLPTIRLMSDYLKEDIYIKIMSDINVVIYDRTMGEVVREIWHLSPIRLKKSFLPYIDGLLWNLLKVNDTRTIDVIISNISTEERNDIGLKLAHRDFTDIILSGKVSFMDTLIVKLLPKDYDIESLKNHILKYESVIYRLINENNIPIVEAWFNWLFPSENKIKYYKKKILNLMKIYLSLIRLNDYDRVNTFLKWYFETEEDITSFKKTFVQESNFSRCFNLLFEMSNDYETGWDRFERFVNHSLSCSEDVSQFKKLYLKSVPTFLKRGNLKFATYFLNWCCNSLDEVHRYKNELLLSKKGIGMLLYRLNHTIYFGWNSFRSILKWFYPLSSEAIDKLKSLKYYKFIGFYDKYTPVNKKRAFIYVLDCLEWKQNSTTEDGGEILDNTDVKCINNILKGKDINGDCNSDSSYNYNSDENNVYIEDNYIDIFFNL